jgi:opacity protein-like surface antigen
MRILLSICVGILASVPLLAQPGEGRTKELSLSGAYQSYSTDESSESKQAFVISPRLGIFVLHACEIEPELVAMLPSGGDIVYMLNGNVSYNFIGEGKGVPFVLLGYGIANTVPLFNIPTWKADFGVGVLNLGGGVKAFLREDIAIRFEYRYQRFSGEGSSYGPSSYTRKVDTRIHTVQFGLSVLL